MTSGVPSLSSEQTTPQNQPGLNDNHKSDLKSRGESERKTLKRSMLRGLPDGHLRLKRTSGTPREIRNESAMNSL
jgi:hypothetical protein